MIKKITTLVSTNKQIIARKALLVGGIALGLVAGALLVKPEEEIVVGEVVEENGSITETNPETD